MSDLRTRAAEAGNAGTRAVQAVAEVAGAAGIPIGTDRPLPNVAESPYAADPGANAVVAWSKVMAEVQWIGKDSLRADAGGRYNFRGIDAVLNAVGPALRKHGVVVMPIKVKPEFTTITTSKGVAMNYCRATVTYRVFGPKMDWIPADGEALGEAFDTGDKSSTKAQSVALRTFYINALAIPTNRPEMDTEYGTQHELGAPKPPTAEEYFAEVMNKGTSIDRLRTIQSEVKKLPAIATQEMTDEFTGETMQLIKWVSKVGAARANAQ